MKPGRFALLLQGQHHIINKQIVKGGSALRIDKGLVTGLAKKYSHAWLFLIFAMLGQQFSLLEQFVVPRYWVYCWVDGYIPFLPGFVIPYMLWFAYIAVGLVVLCLHDREDFIRAFSLLGWGMFIALVIYFFFPHGQPLRPIITHDDIFSRLVRDVIYANDTNTNCCPSIHVLNQLAVHIGLCKSKLMRSRKWYPWFKWASFTFTVLVCASTVFLKQHSIIDVLAALLLEIPLYLLIYKVDWKGLFARRKNAAVAIPQKTLAVRENEAVETATAAK